MLQNGYIRYAPKTVEWHGYMVNNPSAEKLLELGYLPVQYTDMPDNAPDGKYYESGWEETADVITQVWKLKDKPDYSKLEPTMRDLMQAVERGLEA